MTELTSAQKLVFGADAKLHPVTGMPLENGIGALPEKQQALMHLGHIAKEHGKETADAMLKKIVSAQEAEEILARMKAAEPPDEAKSKPVKEPEAVKQAESPLGLFGLVPTKAAGGE